MKIPSDSAELTLEQVANLAELAASHPGVLLTVETEVLLSLLWGYADYNGSCLQTIVDNYGTERAKGGG